MKKILAVSLVAIMAAGAARADIASTTYVKNKTGNLTALTTTNNANLVEAINEVNTNAATAQSAAEAAQATADGAVAMIGTYNADTKEGSGLSKELGDIKESLKSVATTEGLGELTNKVGALETSLTDTGATGSRIVALEAGQETQNTAITDLQNADTTMSGQITALQGADTTIAGDIVALQREDTVIKDKIGTVEEGKTVVGMIAEATYDDAVVRDLISAEESARKTADGDLTKLTTGVKTSLVDAINEVDANAAAAQSAAEAAQAKADANALAIGSYDPETQQGSGLAKDIADIDDAATRALDEAALNAYKIGNVADDTNLAQMIADEESARKTADGDLTKLTTDEKNSLVGAINEVKDIADGATNAAANAQETADGAASAAEAAQETADLKVNKASLGIYEDAENPFVVPDWCKGDVVCSFVVSDGIAGWQKVVDEDPAA